MDAAQAWGRPRERAREGRERPLLQAAALALHPRPRGRPRRKRAPLRCQSCHETRTPGWGKAFGPVLRVSSEKGLGDSVFRCFPASSRKKSTSLRLGVPVTTPWGESWLLRCKTRSGEQNSFPLVSSLSRERGQTPSFSLLK